VCFQILCVGVFLAPVAVLSYAVLILAILRCVECYWDIGPLIFEIEFVAPIHPLWSHVRSFKKLENGWPYSTNQCCTSSWTSYLNQQYLIAKKNASQALNNLKNTFSPDDSGEKNQTTETFIQDKKIE